MNRGRVSYEVECGAGECFLYVSPAHGAGFLNYPHCGEYDPRTPHSAPHFITIAITHSRTPFRIAILPRFT